MNDEELKQRLADVEDGWTERKQEGVSTEDIRKTLVAFANSIPDGEEAVLFIGVSDQDGKITGVESSDKLQKTIGKIASESCYPPINHTARVITVNSNHVIAVIVRSSHNKPHFAGPAFVRSGSESKKASERVFEQLIASRISKARPLGEAMRRGERIAVFHWTLGRINRLAGANFLPGCTVVECTPHYAVFQPATGGQISANYERIELSRHHNNQLRVDIDG